MDQQEEIERLQGEHREWREALKRALEELSGLKEALRLVVARIEELERQREPPSVCERECQETPSRRENAEEEAGEQAQWGTSPRKTRRTSWTIIW